MRWLMMDASSSKLPEPGLTICELVFNDGRKERSSFLHAFIMGASHGVARVRVSAHLLLHIFVEITIYVCLLILIIV